MQGNRPRDQLRGMPAAPQELQDGGHSSVEDGVATQGPRTEAQVNGGRLRERCRTKGAEAETDAGMACDNVGVGGGERWVREVGTSSNWSDTIRAGAAEDEARGRGVNMGKDGGAVEEDGEESDGARRGAGPNEEKDGQVGG